MEGRRGGGTVALCEAKGAEMTEYVKRDDVLRSLGGLVSSRRLVGSEGLTEAVFDRIKALPAAPSETLRDRFAMAALQVFADSVTHTHPRGYELVAKSCYTMADAMMKERVKDGD